MNYTKTIQIRWSDLDPNFHLRHSVYYDWCAFVRISFLTGHGLTPLVLQENHYGPILFREECVFKKEVTFNDTIAVNLKLLKCRKDLSRWTVMHEVWKNTDTLSAVVTVDGAWMDTQTRKLVVPDSIGKKTVEAMPKAENFEWVEV